MSIKNESHGAITIMGLSTIGIRYKKNTVIPLYYSSVFLNRDSFYKRTSDDKVLNSRLPYSKLGNTLIIRVISFESINDQGRKFLEERLKSGNDLTSSVEYTDNNGEKKFLYEQIILETYFFNHGYLKNLAEYVKLNKVKVIFIFHDTPLSIIKLKFFCEGYSISGGNNTLKHVLAPYQTTLYNYLSWLFGDFADKIIEDSFREFTNNRALTRNIFNSWDNRDKLLFDIIKDDYSKSYGSISDSYVTDIINRLTLHTRRDNVSIRDLSINDISSFFINGLGQTIGERGRPLIISERKKKNTI